MWERKEVFFREASTSDQLQSGKGDPERDAGEAAPAPEIDQQPVPDDPETAPASGNRESGG